MQPFSKEGVATIFHGNSVNKMADPSAHVTPVPEDVPLSAFHVNGNGIAAEDEPEEFTTPSKTAEHDKENDPSLGEDAGTAAVSIHTKAKSVQAVATTSPKKPGVTREFPRLGPQRC